MLFLNLKLSHCVGVLIQSRDVPLISRILVGHFKFGVIQTRPNRELKKRRHYMREIKYRLNVTAKLLLSREKLLFVFFTAPLFEL